MPFMFNMWPVKFFRRNYFRTTPLLHNRGYSFQINVNHELCVKSTAAVSRTSISLLGTSTGARLMSTTKGRSMRSKVETRMRRETGRSLAEMRRAKRLRKKLMSEEERLIYNLRRAKKIVSLLLQKLKKFELPELPAPRHDPEMFTPEQLQAYRKIGFRNRNYVPVGVRGVFGGVVQNMHLHWKFHETVQVCCDNFPKERIKEMATMLARLSGGIVINIHNVKTIIMFRGRNYRQPKILIPINTLTKRKALFKARFEQALESQQLNIKKIEQQLRRTGVNPEDPVAMASIQRVASTFFRAIDEKQGTPYVFHSDRKPKNETDFSTDYSTKEPDAQSEDSDQEELDRYIAEIEDAAGQEWEEEEAAEKEEASKIRYWSSEETGQQGRNTSWRANNCEEREGGHDRGLERGYETGHKRGRDSMNNNRRTTDIGKWDINNEIAEESGLEWDSSDEVRNSLGSPGGDEDDTDDDLLDNRGMEGHLHRRTDGTTQGSFSQVMTRSDSDLLDEPDDIEWDSDDNVGKGPATSKGLDDTLLSSDDEETYEGRSKGARPELEHWNEDEQLTFNGGAYSYFSSDDDECGDGISDKGGRAESKKKMDEHWDSD